MRLTLLSILFILSFQISANPPSSFGSGKDQAKVIWEDIGRKSFYCGCAYRAVTPEERAIKPQLGSLRIIPESCNYVAKDPMAASGNIRAQTLRIEWEHVVPAEWIATGFGCQEKTRSECREISGFKQAEGDLFNLVPSVGELNVDRSARLFGEIDGETRDYGACDFEVVKTGTGPSHLQGKAEPMESIRGDIARIWFYMAEQYGVVIPEHNQSLLEQWAMDDPIDQDELKRHDEIAKAMGRKNRFVRP